MIVDCAFYHHGKRTVFTGSEADLGHVRRVLGEDGDFVWVGLHEPTPAEMRKVADLFDLHPLAVEDSLHGHQRPKLERYDGMLFLVLKTLWYVDALDAVETGQLTLFVGRDFVVTVRQGEGVELSSVRLELEQQVAVLGHGPAAVMYAVCDRVVDNYERVVGELEVDVDEVEESVFSDLPTEDSQRIYILKRELSEVRRAVGPLKGPMQQFASGQVPGVSSDAAPFFRDVGDHVFRVYESVEALDSLLSSAFDAHLTRVSVQQNADMRKISAYAALAAVSTLIAGVYGMNFEHMPELAWRFGYAYVLGLMVAASVLLYRLFKNSGWL